MGRVAQFGVYVEILGTFGIAIILAHPRLPPRPRLPVLDRRASQHAATNPLGLDFGGNWLTGAR